MITWETREFVSKKGRRIIIDGATLKDAYDILKNWVKANDNPIAYSKLMDKLKEKNHPKIYRGSIGHIVGHVSDKVSVITNPSIYPSSIVVHKGTWITGDGFWDLEEGTLPPNKVPIKNRRAALSSYQRDVFEKTW